MVQLVAEPFDSELGGKRRTVCCIGLFSEAANARDMQQSASICFSLSEMHSFYICYHIPVYDRFARQHAKVYGFHNASDGKLGTNATRAFFHPVGIGGVKKRDKANKLSKFYTR